MQDIRYAWRVAVKNPGSTAAALIAMVLGVGASISMFSVINAVLLRPLPVHQPKSVVQIYETEAGEPKDGVSLLDFLDWRRHLRSFDKLSIYRVKQMALTGRGPAERMIILECDASLMPLLGITPARGRFFYPEENQVGRQFETLVSWDVWKNRYGGDQGIIGKKVVLNDTAYAIIGVLPEDFRLVGDEAFWVPNSFDMSAPENQRGFHLYQVYGRLRPGVTLAQANADLSAEAEAIARRYPKESHGVGARAISLREAVSGDVRPALLTLFGAVALVLLIACGNTASLLLARASSRQKEMAVRISLGASRVRLFHQLLTESVLLSIVAALAGLALAAGCIRLLRNLSSTHIPHPEQIVLDWRVALFALTTGVVTGIFFGFAPALRVAGQRVHETLKQTSGRITETRAQQRLRQLLITAETALVTMLLVGSGLLIRSFLEISKIHLGFVPQNVVALYVSMTSPRYMRDGAINHFVDGVLTAVRALPGVEDAGFSNNLPVISRGEGGPILVEGQPEAKHMWDLPFAQRTHITPGYFRTMRIPIIRGRDFDEHDLSDSPRVVIINQALARTMFPGVDPIGKNLRYIDRPPWKQVVGIVGDVPQLGLEGKTVPETFTPSAQEEEGNTTLAVRVNGDPRKFVNTIRATVNQVDSSVPIFGLRPTMEQAISYAMGWRRFSTSILAVFAGIGIVLASIGTYALIAYSVTQRTAEIGVRMALGASRGAILWMIVHQGAAPAIVGSIVGALVSLAVSRVLSGMLYGVQNTDFLTYLVAVLFLIAVACAASLIPALRAASVQPSSALRYE
jgi:putative ABC transport system permease protein